MFPSRAPFFRLRIDLRAAEIAAQVDEARRGNLPVSPGPFPTVMGGGATHD
jgi:hypothetical protein